MNDALAAVAADGDWVSLHNTDPGTDGTGELSGARQQTTWNTPVSRVLTGSEVPISVASGENPTHFGVWTAQTGGTFRWGFPLDTPPGVYGAAGQLKVTPRAQG